MKTRIILYLVLILAVSIFAASEVLAECPEGKNPINVTTPSGNTKTLCVPDSALQGIENAAEHSGGTIVAASCPCFTADDVLALDSIGEGLTCKGLTGMGSDGSVIFSSRTCSGDGGKVSTLYDADDDNSCYFNSRGDKYSGIPPVKIYEIISDNDYDACLDNINAVIPSK